MQVSDILLFVIRHTVAELFREPAQPLDVVLRPQVDGFVGQLHWLHVHVHFGRLRVISCMPVTLDKLRLELLEYLRELVRQLLELDFRLLPDDLFDFRW